MSGEQHPPAVPELLHGAGYRHRWLLAFVQPVRFQNAQSWPYARQTQYQPKPNLQIEEFSQAPNEQENILVLRAPLRGKGDFQGIADDGPGGLYNRERGTKGSRPPPAKLRLVVSSPVAIRSITNIFICTLVPRR